jgi:hypothetical protein
MKRRVAIAVVTAAATLCAGTAPRPVHAQDAAAREWNQPRGGFERTGATDMAPVAAEPAIAWREELPGTLAGEPVTWGGLVHAVASDSGKLTLLVYRARTGELIASRPLGKGTWAQLATWQGRIIVAEKGSLRGFPLKDGKIGSPWRRKGDFMGGACVVAGKIAIRDGDKVKLFDSKSGRELAKADWLAKGGKIEEHDAYAALAVRRSGDKVEVGGVYRTREDSMLRMHVMRVEGLDGKKPKFGNLTTQDVVKVVRRPGEEELASLVLGWLPAGDGSGGWYVTTRSSGGGWNGSLVFDPVEARKKKQSAIVTPGAVLDGRLYGFDKPGTLRMLTADRKERALTERGTLPQGAAVGPAVASSGVVCFGNWAMDMENKRTMWVLQDLPEIQTVTPVADGFVLLGCGNELICIAEPDRITAAGAEEAVAGAEDAPEPPRDGDGVLLRSGEKLLGTFTVDDDVVTVRPGKDDAREVSIDEVALGEKGGKVTLRGEEQNTLAAWQNVIDGVFVRGLQEAFEAYRNERLLSDSRRLIADMRAYGAGNTVLESYEASLAGKSENPNADMKRKRLGPIEEKARKQALDQVFAAVDWCTERGYGGAATALLDYAQREGVDDAKIDSLAKDRIPEGFPWPDAPNAGRTWFVWAKAMVPAGGEFIPRSDPLWNRVRGKAPWNQDTLGFRTRNTLLFSRTDDLEIVGMCLRVGEGTVRALEALLGKGAGNLSEPLDVRLHRNREEYLAEKTPSGGALPWSAGYFSPGEGVSRFYVPDPGRSVEPLGRGLSKTLAHELTHHWLSMRWLGKGNMGRAAVVPGYWIVEGFARFIEDQAMEMGRRAGKLDDPTVNSLDACSQVARQKKLIDTAELVGMNQFDFGKIPEKHVADVRLRSSVGNRRLDYRALFYEQSGSLVFFLMNRRGDEGREALIDYMRKHYRGATPKDPSEAFGFESGKDLHEKFEAFLMSLVE